MRIEPTPENQAQRFVQEFRDLVNAPPVTITLTAIEAWIIMATIQLACRHPKNTAQPARMAARFARELQAKIAKRGALAEVAEQGWGE